MTARYQVLVIDSEGESRCISSVPSAILNRIKPSISTAGIACTPAERLSKAQEWSKTGQNIRGAQDQCTSLEATIQELIVQEARLRVLLHHKIVSESHK